MMKRLIGLGTLIILSIISVYNCPARQELSADELIIRGNAWAERGDLERAISDYNEAVKVDPKHAGAHFILGYTWAKKGDYDQAITYLNKAIDIDSNKAASYYFRGAAWHMKYDYGRAIEDYDKTLHIDPHFEKAYSRKAWILSTCPNPKYWDGKKALELAQKAVDLNHVARNIDTLAAAYAQIGKFDEAARTQERAIDKLQQEGDTKAIAECVQRLKAYKAHKPWREK